MLNNPPAWHEHRLRITQPSPALRWCCPALGQATHVSPPRTGSEGSEAGCPEAEGPGTEPQNSVTTWAFQVSGPGSSPRRETLGAQLPGPSPGADSLPDTARDRPSGAHPPRAAKGQGHTQTQRASSSQREEEKRAAQPAVEGERWFHIPSSRSPRATSGTHVSHPLLQDKPWCQSHPPQGTPKRPLQPWILLQPVVSLQARNHPVVETVSRNS